MGFANDWVFEKHVRIGWALDLEPEPVDDDQLDLSVRDRRERRLDEFGGCLGHRPTARHSPEISPAFFRDRTKVNARRV